MIHEIEARQYVLDRVRALPAVTIALSDAVGSVLIGAIVAGEDVPPFVNSAVDGYAVRAADTTTVPVELEVIDEVAAGAASNLTVGAGQAIRIMTGAPMPAGADAAVMVEDTERLHDGNVVLVKRPVRAADAVRDAGDDVRTGDTLFLGGTVLTPAILGVLASINVREVEVTRTPRVAVLSTGDELIDDGSALAPGQIRESNKTMLLALVAAAGCAAIDYGVVRDDEAVLEAVLRRAAAECDAIVTSGGVSMGDYDVVKAVLSTIADMSWMQIAIKPAKPFAFGMLDDGGGRQVPVFGLPGNPVSSMVSFELFARPALQTMLGRPVIDRLRIVGVAAEALTRRVDGKTHYARVVGAFEADGRYHVRSVGGQGSHQLAATASATALAVLPNGDGVPVGGQVDVIVLSVG